MAGRPENAHQARLLKLLRDGGRRSRAELGEAVELSKSKVAVELDRLLEPRPRAGGGGGGWAAGGGGVGRPRAGAVAPTWSASPSTCASSGSTSARPPSTSRSP